MKISDSIFTLGMILAMICWGISWPAGKVLSSYGPAQNVAFWRFFLTFLTLGLLLKLAGQSLKLNRKAIPDVFLAALFMTGYGYLFIFGLSQGSAGAGGVLVTTMNPLMAYGLVLILQRKIPNLAESVGIFLGMMGGLVIINVYDHWRSVLEAGNIYFLLATFLWAVLSRFTAKGARYGSSITFSFWIYGFCSLNMFFISDFQKNLELVHNQDPIFWLCLIFSSSITTALATSFYFYATSRLGPQKSSAYLLLVPLFAAFSAWLLINESPKPSTLVGGAFGIAGLILIQNGDRILNKKKSLS